MGAILLVGLIAASPEVLGQDGELADEIRRSLREELLEVWYPRVVDTGYGGYFSNFTFDWKEASVQDKFIVTQARHVWTLSRAAEFYPDLREAYLDAAEHGFEFMRDHMWDEEHGGFVSLVSRDGSLKSAASDFTRGKTAYGNAFAIYALAAYYDVSHNQDALNLAQRAFGWLDEHAHDPEHGGYFQFVRRDGTPLLEGPGSAPPKDQNSSIHLLEAFTELYHVWKDPVLQARLEEMLALVRDTITVDPGTLQLFFERDWTPVTFRNESESVIRENIGLDHVSFGHDVETAYLMLEAAEALGIDPEHTLSAGKRMVDHALDYGWDAKEGGFFDGAYYFEPGKPPEIVLDDKAWWAQAEALNTLLLLSDHFPEDDRRYYDRFLEMWDYIDEHLIDHEYGGWYVGGLDRRPDHRTAAKAGIWKGAYHDARALINVAARLEALRPGKLFADGMVMQQGREAPVWGWARAGEEVKVTFDATEYTTDADAQGKWMVRIPSMEAGGPHTITIASGHASRSISDILVGDVWIASGQSNMEWTVANSNNAELEISSADDDRIRHFKVPRSWAYEPEETLAGGSWERADPEHVGDFSAAAYFFARELRRHHDVPIGIVNTSWGGSRIEPWMSAGALGYQEGELQALRAQTRAREQRVLDALRARIGDLPERDTGVLDGWMDPKLVDSDWNTIRVPALWEQAGYEGMDGVGWYRTTFSLSADQARRGSVRLSLGAIDDADVTWVNGYEVGRTNSWNAPRIYAIPDSIVRTGENTLAIRVTDSGGGGGIHGDPDALFIEMSGERRPLEDPWKFKVGSVRVSFEAGTNQQPTLLYNKMVYPLQDYPIKGALWYQGESNAGSVEQAAAYEDLFVDLIRSWRSQWDQGNFPFLWVQLANYMAPDEAPPMESGWAELRESQTAALRLPRTAQAVIIDIGETGDIHPRNKQDVGARLAAAARRIAYGESDIVYSGPIYWNHEIEDGKVIVTFDHVGSGLVARGGAVRGFAVAGTEGPFVWADAQIDGDRVIVWSDRVPEPVAVRYAWGNNPIDANLYNEEGLPAAPFRTDIE